MKKHILPIFIVILALLIVLPGIAIAKNTSSSNLDKSPTNQNGSAILIGGKFNLIVQPAPAVSADSAIGVNQLQSTGKTNIDALQGGSFVLSRPGAVDDATGCCCKSYISCIRKK